MEIKNLPISQLRAMPVEEQDKLARLAGTVEKTLKDAQNAHISSFPYFGKVVCIMEERLNDLKSDRDADGKPKKRLIASNTSLATYWETVTKGKSKLNSHAYSCAVAFGTYVRSELITEADYDKNTAQNLELSASISTAVGGEITHEAIGRAARELRERDNSRTVKNSTKVLQSILDEVKEPKAMTQEQAKATLAKLMAGGFLNLVISTVGAEIAHLADPEAARSAFFGMVTAHSMFAANVDDADARRYPDTTLDAWAAAYENANVNETPEAEKLAA